MPRNKKNPWLDAIRGVLGDRTSKKITKMLQPAETLDYSGQNLKNENFCDKNLQGVNFSKCNLQGAKFWSSNLNFCDFSDADIRGATFWAAKLTGVNFKNAKYSWTTRFSKPFSPPLSDMNYAEDELQEKKTKKRKASTKK